MKLFIYKLDKILYEGDADAVTLPSQDGQITILNHHIPLVTPLKAGDVAIKSSTPQTIGIKGGFAEIKPEKVILLVE